MNVPDPADKPKPDPVPPAPPAPPVASEPTPPSPAPPPPASAPAKAAPIRAPEPVPESRLPTLDDSEPDWRPPPESRPKVRDRTPVLPRACLVISCILLLIPFALFLFVWVVCSMESNF